MRRASRKRAHQNEVYVGNMRLTLNPSNAVGKGGEADIYDIGGGKVIKIFKSPEHLDFDGLLLEQHAARERIKIHQAKLPAFPANLPERVVKPETLATDSPGGEIIGYTMRMIKDAQLLRKYSSRLTTPHGVERNDISGIFIDLHHTITSLHRAGVIIGDYNDLNVLVKNEEAYLIDADSFQYRGYLCTVFTLRFLDPLLCDGSLSPVKAFTELSDWYAYTVMLLQSLLFVDPYGGVYVPDDPSRRIAHDLRPLNRITIFHPEVRYPKSAIPYSVLPDGLLHFFQQVFLLDYRGPFPLELIRQLRWTYCSSCGKEHGRQHCPHCTYTSLPPAPAMVRGSLTVTEMFKTTGLILSLSPYEGRLLWLYHQDGQFFREDGNAILTGELSTRMRLGICGRTTLVGRGKSLLAITPGEEPRHTTVDLYNGSPAFDSNGQNIYWIKNGRLQRQGSTGAEYLGDALEGQTYFCPGQKFGFGFYRAGQLCIAFVFDTLRRGINDSLDIPYLKQPIIDVKCYFAGSRCWLFLATQEQGRTIHRCIIVRSNGFVEGEAEAVHGDGTWLGADLGGKCAAGDFLLAPTDDGIVKVECHGSSIEKTREFPDTEDYVDEQTRLYPGRGGIFAVRESEILFLTMK